MEHSDLWDYLRQELEIPLNLKKEELHLFDYKTVSEDEIWDCLKHKCRKKKREELQKHEVVSVLLTLRPAEIMQRITQNSWNQM